MRAKPARRSGGMKVPNYRRQLFAVTYGEPPDPPATTALIEALQNAAR